MSQRTMFTYDEDEQVDRKHIRLLRFQINEDDGIICEMHTFRLRPITPLPRRSSGSSMSGVALNEIPRYRALSYTWGDSVPLRNIVIRTVDDSGSLHDRNFAIRDNLFRFLVKYANGEMADGWIWIDQISINQASNQEKCEQVQIMGTIYRGAEEVLCWLGADAHKGRAIALINRMNDTQPIKQPHFRQLCEDDQKAWRDFVENRYWSRLWIVQEVMHARKLRILFGDSDLSGQVFGQFCKGRFGAANTTELIKWIMFKRKTEPNIRINITLPALKYTTKSQCENPHDKIYGLQSLFEKGDRVAVDYKKPVEELYLEVAQKLANYGASMTDGHLYTYRETLYYVARGMGLLRQMDFLTFRERLEERQSPEDRSDEWARLQQEVLRGCLSTRVDSFGVAVQG